MTSIETGLGVGNTRLSSRCTVIFACRSPLWRVATSPRRQTSLVLAQQLTKARLSDEARAAAAKAEDEQKVLETAILGPSRQLNNLLRFERIRATLFPKLRASRPMVGGELLKVCDLIDGVFDGLGDDGSM